MPARKSRWNDNGEPRAKRGRTASPRRPAMSVVSYEQLQKNSGEKKGVDIGLSFGTPILNTLTTNAGIRVLNLVGPGSGSYNRVGRKIFCKSVRLKGYLDALIGPQTTTADLDGMIVRMAVIWDKQPSGVLPSFDDVFEITDQAGTEAPALEAPPKYDNMGRFQILRDRDFVFNPTLPASSGGTTNQMVLRESFDEYIKLGNRTTVYSAQNTPCTIADIATGGLYVIWRCNLNTANVNTVSISDQSYARLRYSD